MPNGKAEMGKEKKGKEKEAEENDRHALLMHDLDGDSMWNNK
jgi:hypothetical protein